MKVIINLSEEMNSKFGKYCKAMGTNRSALGAILISQALMTYDKMYEGLDRLLDEAGKHEKN